MKASRAAATLCAAALAVSGPGTSAYAANRVDGRASTLSVWHDGAWREFWRSDRAPTRWIAPDAQVHAALQWRRLANGLEWATLRLSCGGPTCRARLVVARLDPTVMKLSLRMDLTRGEMRPAWSIDRAPAEALLAVNAGQFGNTMPWGWVALDGRQLLRPGYGPLSSAIAIDGAGSVRWFHGDSLLEAAGVTAGFQSYPTLLAGGGVVPAALRSGDGVNLTHRDTRLAIGETRDGRILIAMTRFDAMGELSQGFPLGPTTPEMAALMGALGASDAVMLDGGISAQLLLRDRSKGKTLRWPGLRKVPLALIATPRPVGATTSKR
jgi:Phosphodiester glycosidase